MASASFAPKRRAPGGGPRARSDTGCRTTIAVANEERRPWRRWPPLIRRVLSITGAVLVLAGFVWLWWQGVPALYGSAELAPDTKLTAADQLKAITDTRTALLAGLAAAGALGTFWLNARTQRFTAETLRISEANFQLAERSQKESFKLAERGHLTDRYTKAIAQIGDDKLDVRLGGIYALEQLATDSENAGDQATLVEVLSAFVRVHSDPLYQSANPADEGYRRAAAEGPAVDVQAAVTVLGRLPARSETKIVGPNFTGAWLSKADLARANLSEANLNQATLAEADLAEAILTKAKLNKANLVEADLTKADLTGARLEGAIMTKAKLNEANLVEAGLTKADLTGARLGEATLTGARLGEATLTGANLDRADLTGARLDRADLTGADLMQADLTGARLGEAILTGARLWEAKLTGADLWRAKLTGVELIGADLTGVELIGADLTGASLRGADLSEATLDGAQLNRADLSMVVGLTQERLGVAVGDSRTKLPHGLQRPEWWPVPRDPEPR